MILRPKRAHPSEKHRVTFRLAKVAAGPPRQRSTSPVLTIVARGQGLRPGRHPLPEFSFTINPPG